MNSNKISSCFDTFGIFKVFHHKYGNKELLRKYPIGSTSLLFKRIFAINLIQVDCFGVLFRFNPTIYILLSFDSSSSYSLLKSVSCFDGCKSRGRRFYGWYYRMRNLIQLFGSYICCLNLPPSTFAIWYRSDNW